MKNNATKLIKIKHPTTDGTSKLYKNVPIKIRSN